MSALVVVRSYGRLLDAELARMRLQSAGIPAFLPDEHVTRIDPLLVSAVGGVRLQVRTIDLERAVAILDAPHDDHDDASDEPACPACDSPYFVERRDGRAKCQRCHHVFPLDDGDASPPLSYRVPERSRTRPTFRLRRGHPGVGLVVGFGFGSLAALVLGAPALALAGAAVGFFVGRSITYDVCSDPSCRAPLRERTTACPSCKRTIEGIVSSTPAHHRQVAAWRRGALPPRQDLRKTRGSQNEPPRRMPA